MLNPAGELVHGFRAYAVGRRNPTYVDDELQKALAKMDLPPYEAKPAETFDALKLPEVKPAGVRLYIKPASKAVIVEAVAVDAKHRTALSWPAQPGEIDAEVLREWLVQVYPTGIRAAEQQKGYKSVAGKLKLLPDSKTRQAVLSGSIKLEGEAGDSRFEGTLRLVLAYGEKSAEVLSLRGFVEGTYHYRVHGRDGGEVRIEAALESTPK